MNTNTARRSGLPKFSLILLLFLALALPAKAADGSRYLVKSKSQFLKNAFNARRNFDNGFTADLNDWQIKAAKLLGVELEPVAVLQVSPLDTKAVSKVKPRVAPTGSVSWGLAAVYGDTDLAKNKPSGGTGVKVAVLDTGSDVNHPDLKSQISSCRDFTTTRLPYFDSKCEDKNGHGTHVAGIIAATGGTDGQGIYGIAPEAQLMIYKVCSTSGICYADDVAAALTDAVADGADIINLSLGGDKSSNLIYEAIKSATNADVLVVAAAGNDGPYPESINYPAAYSEVVAVGAFDVDKKIPDWSAHGINSITKPLTIEEKDIEFAAPGVNIESTWKGGGYAVLSGTSMSTPFISGLAAKLWTTAADKNDSATLVRQALHTAAENLDNETTPGSSDTFGFGFPHLPISK